VEEKMSYETVSEINKITGYLRENLIEAREYQLAIAKQCVAKNSLVVLPTGLGKTLIAVYVAAKTLEQYPKDNKVIILAPTRPLISQHYEFFKKFLTIPEELFTVLTGKTPPEQRTHLFNKNRLLFYTPQTLRNDIASKKYSLANVCLIVFDEAHHSMRDYPYSLIADEYMEQNPDGNILGLTASPGASKEKIKELCNNLHINLKNIYTRIRTDDDVKDYLKPLDIYKVGVNLTELMADAYMAIKILLEERLQYLSQFGFLDTKAENLFEKVIRKDLLRLNSELVKLVHGDGDKTGVYTALSINAQALILYHMIELIEQQGLDVLLIYLKKLKEDARKKTSSKAVKILSSDHRLNQVMIELLKNEDLSPENLIHPKYKVLEPLLLEELFLNPSSRVLVFVKLRDSVRSIVSKLKQANKLLIKPSRFVGQSTKSQDDKGLSQKKQLEILDQFKRGDLNILVSTNVGEEGLDIAECDLVVFYDVVASEIRYIQRRGRTARHREGKVIILYCKDTHDETYLKIALSKMKRMNINLKTRQQLSSSYSQQVISIESDSKKVLSKEDYSDQTNIKPLSDKSKMDFFIRNSSERNSIPQYAIKLSKAIPSKFGLRKSLQKDEIPFEINLSENHIEIVEKVVIQIIDPLIFKEGKEFKLVTWINSRKINYDLIILIFDFIDFKEQLSGEARLLKEQILQFGNKQQIQSVAIDNIEELYFIVKSIYDHTKKGESLLE
jgi:ERCC4-related helicase